MDETATLSKYVSDLRFEDLPPDVIALAQTAIRDALGVALYSSQLEWTQIVAAYASATGGAGKASIIATGEKVAPALAAMANGTAVHGIEMDDRSAALDLHNGAATVPAALAAAEQADATGRDLITGLVAGYEVAHRVARATQGSIRPRFYGSAIRNTIGATSAAAKILGLGADATTRAIGVAGTFAAGSEAAHGYFVKRLQGGGWPAHNALTAALLSQRGLTASPTALEEPLGLIHAFSTGSAEPNVEELTKGLGESFAIRTWETKPYSSWGGAHTSLDAVRILRNQHGIEAADIAAIAVGVSDKNLENVRMPWPVTVMEGQKHLQFLIAAQFLYDLRDPDTWKMDLDDPAVVALAAKISGDIDPVIQQNYLSDHDHGGVRMTVTTVGGREIPVEVRYSTGTEQNPLPDADLREKFRMLAGKHLSAKKVESLESYVDGLPDLSSAVDLGPFLTH
ncbi:MAG: MmgE/PrpD family protein [Mycobacterium sp.]